MILEKTEEDFKKCGCEFCSYVIQNNLVNTLGKIKNI